MFIVEDGTGLVDANSYVTVAELQAYCLSRGIDVTTDTDEVLQENLVNATDYIDLTYTFIGDATTTTQVLQFPRTKDDADYGVPTKVKYATIEMAISSKSGVSLFADADRTITSKKEKVGVIETELDYDDSKVYQTNSSRFPKVNKYLKDWIDSFTDNAGQLKVISG